MPTPRGRKYRQDALDSQPHWCARCKKVLPPEKLEAAHLRPLWANGPDDWTRLLCEPCHAKETRSEAAERARRKRSAAGRTKPNSPRSSTRSSTRSPARKAPMRKPKLAGDLARYAIGAVLVAAAVWWIRLPGDTPSRKWHAAQRDLGLDQPASRRATKAPDAGLDLTGLLHTVVVVALLAAAVAAGVAYLRWRAARRRDTLDRLGEALARETHTDPLSLRIKVRRWEAGIPVEAQARYSSLFDDEPGSAGCAKVEALLARKIGQSLDITWRPARDTVLWAPGTGTPRPAAAEPAQLDDRTGKVQESVETSLRAVIKGDVAVRWGAADAVGPLTFAVDYPAAFNDESSDMRQTVVERVNAKAPGRWRATWDTEQNRVRFDRRPNMPKSIDRPIPAGGKPDTWRLPLGVDEAGEIVHWDLRTMPHMLVAGTTGGGKTVTLSGLLVEALARGFDVVIVDGKGTALAGFRDWPGVIQHGLGEPEDMAEAMEWAEDLMRKRYARIREHGTDPDEFTPVLVILDEAAEFATAVKRWHGSLPRQTEGLDGEKVPRPKDAPSLDAWRSIARLGREGHVHLVVGIQQAAASFFGGTESREQLPARVGCGPLKAEGARMLFGRGDVGRDLPTSAKGRATVEVDDHGPREMQTYWTPTPRADGFVRESDAGLLDPFRAAAEELHHHPSRRRALPAPQHTTPAWEDQPELPPASEQPEQPAWEDVALDALAEGDVVLVDEDGAQVEATVMAPPCESADDDSLIELDYRTAAGAVGMALLDADSSIARRLAASN